MFKNYGVMPGRLAKENPFVLFKMLDEISEERETEVVMDGYLKMFYGE